MNAITTIIFDFGGVVGADANSWTNDTDVTLLTGLSTKKIDEVFFAHWDALKGGNEDLQVFFDEVVQQSKKDVTTEQLRELYHRKILINETILTIAKTLSTHYKLYILANESVEGMNVKIKKFHLTDYFLTIFNSAELRLSKPDPKIFTTVLERIQSPVETVLFIDDQKRNILAAEKLGITSIHFKTDTNLIQELTALSLL